MEGGWLEYINNNLPPKGWYTPNTGPLPRYEWERVVSGTRRDVVDFLSKWLTDTPGGTVIIGGERRSGRTTVARQICRQVAEVPPEGHDGDYYPYLDVGNLSTAVAPDGKPLPSGQDLVGPLVERIMWETRRDMPFMEHGREVICVDEVGLLGTDTAKGILDRLREVYPSARLVLTDIPCSNDNVAGSYPQVAREVCAALRKYGREIRPDYSAHFREDVELHRRRIGQREESLFDLNTLGEGRTKYYRIPRLEEEEVAKYWSCMGYGLTRDALRYVMIATRGHPCYVTTLMDWCYKAGVFGGWRKTIIGVLEARKALFDIFTTVAHTEQLGFLNYDPTVGLDLFLSVVCPVVQSPQMYAGVPYVCGVPLALSTRYCRSEVPFLRYGYREEDWRLGGRVLEDLLIGDRPVV